MPNPSIDDLVDDLDIVSSPSLPRHAIRERPRLPLRYRLADALTPHRPRHPVRLAVVLTLLVLAGLAVCGAILLREAQHAQQVVARMRTEADTLKRQAAAFDLQGAAVTMKQLRQDADDARATTDGPLWATATWMPVLGDDVSAARDVSASVASILDAAQPLEAALPRLDPKVTKGRLDVAAIADVARALPNLSTAVAKADATVARIPTSGLQPQLAEGVATLHTQLGGVRDPLASAVPALKILPAMLGADRPKTWAVLLEQDAEARGTGGLVGAFAVVRTNKGDITLADAAQRETLRSRKIPPTAVPQTLRDLWGSDITEWAGLNLSPHFPWTGQLVSAGWSSKKGEKLDYVAAIDQYAVAALLAGTGPIRIGDDVVTSKNAVPFLSRDVYLRHPRFEDVDRITGELVTQAFGRLAAGKLDLKKMVTAVATQSSQRRVLVWSADPDEQLELETLSVGGALPSAPGPFAMSVVNNGGGNKMDAYLKVRTVYKPGSCVQGSRIGDLQVSLTSTAPTSGLTEYQSVRSDLLDRGVKHWTRGSNRILLDLYGPVGSQAPLITVDGVRDFPIASGSDRGHSVWRLQVPIDPGQARVVRAVIVQPVDAANDAAPQVLVQPMAIPATASIGVASPCD